MLKGWLTRMRDEVPGLLRHLGKSLRRLRPIPADELDLEHFTRRQKAQIRMNYRGQESCQTCYDTGDVDFNNHERLWNPCPDCLPEATKWRRG